MPIVLAALLFLLLIPAMLLLPRMGPLPEDVVSAGVAVGYHTGRAFHVAVTWCGLCVALGFLMQRRVRSSAFVEPTPTALPHAAPSRTRRGIELASLGCLVVLAYWPPFLSRAGPFIEDDIFLNASQRALSGLQPYADFEFLYGPLLLLLPTSWMRAFGFSMGSYYALLAALEALVLGGVLLFLQGRLPRFRERLIAFGVAAILLVNPLLGLNYNGLRRLLPLIALMLLARPTKRRAPVLAAGLLAGIGLAFEHGATLPALAAAAVLIGFDFVAMGRARALLRLGLFYGTAGGTWLLTTLAATGSTWSDYLRESLTIVQRFSAGEASFEFYWTGLSLALFGLLGIGLIRVGHALRAGEWRAWTFGDRLVLCGLPFAVLSLRSGLNRADVWHMGAAMLPTVVVLVGPFVRRATRQPARVRSTMLALVALLCLANLVGNLPSLGFLAQGWSRGAADVLGGVPRGNEDLQAAASATIREQSRPDPDLVAVTNFLSQPPRSDRVVFYYGSLWSLGPLTGIPHRAPLNDDFLYSDEKGRAAHRWLEAQKSPIIVMRVEAWERLMQSPDEESFADIDRKWAPSLVKRIGSWMSTVHFRMVPIEERLKQRRWELLIGRYVAEAFEPTLRTGSLLVLEHGR